MEELEKIKEAGRREKEEILWKGGRSFCRHHYITIEEHEIWMIADGENVSFFPEICPTIKSQSILLNRITCR